jgi:colanic acid biosynthesis glycosyl transferase WcaI
LNVALLDPRPRGEQREFLNACDVGIVTLVRRMWGVSMPSRTYNILAAGKPILALTEKDSEIDRVVREEGVGWCTEPGDPERLLATIREIYDERERLAAMGVNARRAAETKYALGEALRKYRTALE